MAWRCSGHTGENHQVSDTPLVSPRWGIIRRPPGPSISSALPVWRFRLVNLVNARTLWFLSLYDRFQVCMFARRLQRLLEPTGLVILDANLWFDGGRGVPSPLHTEIWWSAPLRNRLLQIWIPVVCEGSPMEISNSMLRLDPQPVAQGWTIAPGTEHYSQLYSGETRPLPHATEYGYLKSDIPGAIGGRELEVGDVLYFDGAYAHYTLASRARRVGLAFRLTHGEPVYNGYFEEPRPLDGKTPAEATRQLFQALLNGLADGQQIPRDHFLRRYERMPRRWRWAWKIKSALLLYQGGSGLHPVLREYADRIAEQLLKTSPEADSLASPIPHSD